MRSSTLLLTAAAVAVVTAALVALPAFADSKTYSLSGFDEINVSAGIDVTFTQGPFSVRADDPKGKFEKLIIEKRGNTLRISRENNWLNWSNVDYHVAVSAPNLVAIDASSGSSFEGSSLSLSDLKVDVSSGANVELSGSCGALRVDVSSGADFEGENLKCETAAVDASSGADADAFAARSADGNASSGGSVTFHGRPPEMTKDTSSGGSVRAR
jgi:hypothetical protein